MATRWTSSAAETRPRAHPGQRRPDRSSRWTASILPIVLPRNGHPSLGRDPSSGRPQMQGTIVRLMALSGLGCHHKSCGPAVVSACYGGGCYGGGCYGGGYGGCFGGGYGGCFGGMSYTSYVAPACYSSGYSMCYT